MVVGHRIMCYIEFELIAGFKEASYIDGLFIGRVGLTSLNFEDCKSSVTHSQHVMHLSATCGAQSSNLHFI